MYPSIEIALGAADELLRAGRFAETHAIYHWILSAHPAHAPTWNRLGLLEAQSGNGAAGAAALRRAIHAAPHEARYHANLGMILEFAGQQLPAWESYREAVRLGPNTAEFQFLLGNAWRYQGNIEQAIACFREAVRLEPTHAAALNNLGNGLRLRADFDQAAACFQAALHLNPADAGALANLAGVYDHLGRFAAARDCYRRVLSINASSPEFLSLAAAAQGSLCYSSLFDPVEDAPAIARHLTEWNRRQKLVPFTPTRRNAIDPTPHRKLRVGYVSPDFRDHCQAFFMLPLLSHLDPSQFEVCCYSDAPAADSVTDRIRALAPLWRATATLSDPQLADLIAADRIDLLVDLTMHMAGTRLGVFARKPAPLQLTWLAYPGSTGLDTIDYRLSDPYLDPPGTDALYSEKTCRLPHTFWCFDPFDDHDTQPGPLPAAATGAINFGCLNNFRKVNDEVLRLWAGLLHAVPSSRLVLSASHEHQRHSTATFLQALDIAPNRLQFQPRLPRKDYLNLYHHIDISLDTLPYNGHTTSLDSLFMGVPVVTLVGQTIVGRAGLSQLTNLGLPELIAHTPQDYVRIAAELAGDLPRLAHLRATLRQRMQNSPLMDAPRFARDTESIYRQIWREWCARSSPSSQPAP